MTLNKKELSQYFSKLGKKGGTKTKTRGREYYARIGKLGTQKRWKKHFTNE
jgi:hypothetical protein